VGVALFVLRAKEPAAPRPFKVPLYPVTPIIFILTCAYLFWSSVTYVKGGALVGLGVLGVGVILMLVGQGRGKA
jgi:amino acid transporter